MDTNDEVQIYINDKKKLYDDLFLYLDSDNDEEFISLAETINNFHYEQIENFEHVLRLLLTLYTNKFQEKKYIKKIERILKLYRYQILDSFSNIEIFNIFKSNKRILLFLIEENIIIIDKSILKGIVYEAKHKGRNYFLYFYPEFELFYGEKKFERVKNKILEIDSNFFDDFEEKRHIGENDSYICSLIRNDSIEEFITYIHQINLSLSSQIRQSVFENNPFLLKNSPTLIEYAAYFGSIQIFQYLNNNNIPLTSSLWLYVSHSNNAELIQFLEENEMFPYETNLICKELIKCHNNEIANYFNENYMDSNIYDDEKLVETDIISCIYKYHNYYFLQYRFVSGYTYYLSKYKYYILADKYFEKRPDEITLVDNNEIEDNFYENNHEITLQAIYPLIYRINDNAYNECHSLREISLPPTLTFIGANAFSNCHSLKKIFIPSNVKTIGYNAFGGCSSLKKVTFEYPSSLKTFGVQLFFKCSSLKEIIIPSSVTSIEPSCFEECLSLKKVSIPFSVKKIGHNAFSNCYDIETISIPLSVTSIGEHAFFCCYRLKKVLIHSMDTLIGKSAFENNAMLTFQNFYTNMHFDNQIINNYNIKKMLHFYQENFNKNIPINNNVFNGHLHLKQNNGPIYILNDNNQFYIQSIFDHNYSYSMLTHVSIPSSVKSIKKCAFYRCSSLIQVKFDYPSSVTTIDDYAFSECKSLEQITIPSSVIEIKLSAFSECSSLCYVSFDSPSSIEVIDFCAFNKCTSLQEINIPSPIKFIKSYAFSKCPQLIEMSIGNSLKKAGNNAFDPYIVINLVE